MMGSSALQDQFRRVADLLRRSRSILVITGAGLSADSGLPTYRGVGGLYEQDATEEGLAIEEAISGDMLALHPEVTWKYLLQMEKACRATRFNRGHSVVADMEKKFRRVWVLTQNIDGFHRAAGSRQVIDIHGDIHELTCTRCSFAETVADYSGLQTVPPSCPQCRAWLRPKVVLFGEFLSQDKISLLHRELAKGFDLIFTIGTTSVFPYIAGPVIRAREQGIPTVEINPGTSEVSGLVTEKIPAGAAASLEAIWAYYGG